MGFVTQKSVGTICCAPYLDGTWYRAQIKKLISLKKVGFVSFPVLLTPYVPHLHSILTRSTLSFYLSSSHPVLPLHLHFLLHCTFTSSPLHLHFSSSPSPTVPQVLVEYVDFGNEEEVDLNTTMLLIPSPSELFSLPFQVCEYTHVLACPAE